MVASDLVWTAVVVVVALAIAGGVWAWLLRQEGRRRAGLAQMAARRGWRLEMREASGGVPRRVVVSDAGWRCEVTSRRGTAPSSGGSVAALRMTEFRDPACRPPEGLAVAIGPPMPAAAQALAGSLLGGLQGMAGDSLLGRLFGDVGAAAAGLRPIEAPEAVQGQASLFATGPLPGGIALAPILAATLDWRARHGQEDAFPILLWHAGGLMVRMRTDAMEASMLEDFVDTALALRAALAAGG
jgi:hypothetical protein